MDNKQQARNFFPRGLYQPPGSFRFSADALLLSAFFTPVLQELDAKSVHSPAPRLLDIGTGCGVVALSLLRHSDRLTATGVDVRPELVSAALRNAENLGFSSRFSALHIDISRTDTTAGIPEASIHAQEASCDVAEDSISSRLEAIPRHSFTLTLANPPYRKENQGRKPATDARTTALVEKEAGLEDFCRAAAWALKPKGRFGLVFPAPRLPDLIQALSEAGFGLRRLLPLHSREEEKAKLVLVEAWMGCSHDMAVEPPLVLYEGRGENTRLSDAALVFCPDLGVNPRGRHG